MNIRDCFGRYSPFNVSCVECRAFHVCKLTAAIRLKGMVSAFELNTWIIQFEATFGRNPTIREFSDAFGRDVL
jgi:hypothetical protein